MATMDDQEHRDSGDPNDRVNELFAEYVDRMIDGEMLNLRRIASDHPSLADALIERLQMYHGLGNTSCAGTAALGTLGDYTLRRQIGRGGMGVVYEAWQNSLDRHVALKVLPPGIAADIKSSTRFIREAQIAARLTHTNIVPVFASGVEGDTPYYAMEYVEGETLAQILTRIEDSDPETETPFGKQGELAFFSNLARAFADVADGLQHAHSRGVTHRDMKPSNLILDHDGRLRILDFGLARLEGQESLTRSGDFVGTPLYMSPEQARRKRISVDHRTDVYSVGATMYQAICRRPPFRGKDHADTLSQIIERDPVEPRKINPRLPKDLETIVLKCLRKEAANRYGTAEALGQDLRRFVHGDPIEARTESRLERWTRRLRAHRGRLVAASGFAILGALVLYLGMARWSKTWLEDQERYEAGVLAAAATIHGGRLGGSEREGRISPVPFLEASDLAHLAGRSGRPLEHATRELEGLQALDPHRFEAPFYRALALLSLGRKDEARDALEQSRQCDPGFIPGRILLSEIDGEESAGLELAKDSWERHWVDARRALKEGRWEEAARSFGTLVRREMDDGRPLYLGSLIETLLGRGIALLECGGHSTFAAQRAFSQAEALWPDLLEPSLLLAVACYRGGAADDARRIFAELHDRAEADQRNRVVYWIVAAARDVGDYNTALSWAKKLEPERLRELVRAVLFLFAERRAEAARAAERAVEAGPPDGISEAVLALALVFDGWWHSKLVKNRVYGEAVEHAHRAHELEPHSAPVNAVLAFTLFHAGQGQEARTAARRALQLDDQHLGVVYLAGFVLRGENSEKGEEIFRRGIDLAKRRGLRREEAICRMHLAIALELQGRQKAAFEEYRRSVDVFPEGDSYWNLGRVYSAWGDFETAERMYRQAIDASPDPPIRWVGLARALKSRGRYLDALAAIDTARKTAPDCPNAYRVRGRIQDLLGDLDAAVESYVQAVSYNPDDPWALRRLATVLHRHVVRGGDRRLDPLVEALDADGRLEDRVQDPIRLAAWGMVLLRAATGRNVERALDLAQGAVEAGEDPECLTTLACVEHDCGEEARAVRTLERAAASLSASSYVLEILERWRGELAEQYVSYATVDARGTDRSAGGLNSHPIAGEADPEEAHAALYARARRLEEKGLLAEAEDAFHELALDDPRSPAPRLGLTRCLVRQEKSEAAEANLRSWLLSGRIEEREAWNVWLALCFTKLSLAPAQVLGRLGPRTAADVSAQEPSYLADLRWLLGQLKSAGAVRILCGSPGERSLAGRDWSPDRFHVGGTSVPGPVFTDPDSTAAEAVFEGVRRFESRRIHASYRIPLPPGRYRATLWLSVARCDGEDGAESIQIESHSPVDCEEIELDFVHACRRSVELSVNDGILNIEFKPGIVNLNVAAIEIEGLD